MERKEPSTSEVAHIGSELAIFKGVICETAEILGAFLALLNSNVAPVFSKLALHKVKFGPCNWVNLAQINFDFIEDLTRIYLWSAKTHYS